MTFELILTDEQDVPAELHELETRAINAPRLDADLKAAHGTLVAGVAHDSGCVRVLLTAVPDELTQLQIEGLVSAHDAGQMTPAQIAEAQRAQEETAAKPGAQTALAAYSAAMADLTDNWASLAAGAKLEAVRVGVIVALRLLRWLAARAVA
jgi:hypothetical protein